MRSKIASILYAVGTTIKDWAYRVDDDFVPPGYTKEHALELLEMLTEDDS